MTFQLWTRILKSGKLTREQKTLQNQIQNKKQSGEHFIAPETVEIFRVLLQFCNFNWQIKKLISTNHNQMERCKIEYSKKIGSKES